MSIPNDAPIWRPLICKTCGRFCGATADAVDDLLVYCRPCREWRKAATGGDAEIAPHLWQVIRGSKP